MTNLDLFFRSAWFFYQLTVGVGTVILVYRIWKFCDKVEEKLK